jgi:uridine phosphorylase
MMRRSHQSWQKAICGNRDSKSRKPIPQNDSEAGRLISTVITSGNNVLLLETGMGSMNASLVMWELEASLRGKTDPRSRRVLKIGTCSGLYPDEPAGSVLIPDCALNDEGASKWNEKIIDWDEWHKGLLGRLKEKPCEPYSTLTADWRNYLETRCAYPDWASLFLAKHRRPGDKGGRAAIWSIDNFHGVRLLVDKIYPLVHGHLDLWPDTVPVGLENECSSHFSASQRLELPIAAALVVSWSCDHVLHLVTKGEDIRRELKDKVHDTEKSLIVHAVNYLLYENPPG